METYTERIERIRADYRQARARFGARLRDAPDAAAHRVPDGGGWSAAQVGWHVAAVDASFAAILSPESTVAKPLADGETARTWPEVVASIPEKLVAGRRVQPPDGVRREDVLAALDESAQKLDAALAGLTEERASGFAITHPAIGSVALGQIGEWATAHVARHNAQAKRALAAASA